MPKYEVSISRLDYFTVMVDSENPEEAKEDALEAITQSGNPWETYGHGGEDFSVDEVIEKT